MLGQIHTILSCWVLFVYFAINFVILFFQFPYIEIALHFALLHIQLTIKLAANPHTLHPLLWKCNTLTLALLTGLLHNVHSFFTLDPSYTSLLQSLSIQHRQLPRNPCEVCIFNNWEHKQNADHMQIYITSSFTSIFSDDAGLTTGLLLTPVKEIQQFTKQVQGNWDTLLEYAKPMRKLLVNSPKNLKQCLHTMPP